MNAPTQPRHLPLFKVILHNDDENSMHHVIDSIVELTPLNQEDAMSRANEAHYSGCSLLLVIHRERAELYEEQFRSKSLTVTIEPVE
ncbi:MAG: ATP-dependent Clp protease adaptor ClpS [Phycisphaerales bacterium]|nr:ATP-dependent Clp protease adaptor ClpS [Phycisphaerales bacterium]